MKISTAFSPQLPFIGLKGHSVLAKEDGEIIKSTSQNKFCSFKVKACVHCLTASPSIRCVMISWSVRRRSDVSGSGLRVKEEWMNTNEWWSTINAYIQIQISHDYVTIENKKHWKYLCLVLLYSSVMVPAEPIDNVNPNGTDFSPPTAISTTDSRFQYIFKQKCLKWSGPSFSNVNICCIFLFSLILNSKSLGFWLLVKTFKLNVAGETWETWLDIFFSLLSDICWTKQLIRKIIKRSIDYENTCSQPLILLQQIKYTVFVPTRQVRAESNSNLSWWKPYPNRIAAHCTAVDVNLASS